MFTSLIALSLLSLSLGAPAIKRNNDIDFSAVNAAPNALAREKLLGNDAFKFDFFNPSTDFSSGPDGRIVTADAKTFAASLQNGVSLSIGILGPCGLNTPHVHPRATEFNLAINGTLDTLFFQENGGQLLRQTLAPGQATIFPAGGIHAEMNTGCDTAMFVAAFSDPDPGVLSVAQGFFEQLPSDYVAVTLGDVGVQEVEELKDNIPNSVAFGLQECLDRCGLTRTTGNE